MDRIAFIIGENFIYWSAIVMALAVAGAVCVFLALYLSKPGHMVAGFLAVPMSIAFSLVLSRLVHWYCRADSYDSMAAALTDYSTGSYALMGVFAGCFLAAVLLRIFRISRNLPEMLDCMSLAGAAGIALGRLASFFNTSGRGLLVESTQSLPWVWPVTNVVSGAVEYRLATFLLQSVITGVLFLVLLAAYWAGARRGKMRHGDICVFFLLCHGAAQVVMDSTRYDSLFFRSNGFVSIVQVLGAVAIGLTAIYFSVRLVKNRGFKLGFLPLWLAVAALMGVGGYMEYHVQRHGSEALFAYTVMSSALVGLIVLCLVIYLMAGSGEAEAHPVTVRRKGGRYAR